MPTRKKTPHRLTHTDAHGRAGMVDVSTKPVVRRTAKAEAFLVAKPSTLDLLMQGKLPKGEALCVARIAGIAAAKRTDELIPLCHTLPIEHAGVSFERRGKTRLRVTATATVTARTGVEMESLTAVSLACLTLYDMAKAVDKTMHIEGVRVVEKSKAEVAADDRRWREDGEKMG
ncbi:MAG: cyclic pyranopterin monophosphate synthase MoaC [Phycisphaera sp.]|nr:cyclic pyranopterin monophosphate synthase MoaC [Phycisphaera sp.]